MDTFWNDVRFAARMLAKSPGFTLVAVLALALGIGANTALFTVVNGVLLRPLPYPHPDRLVQIWESGRNDPGHYAVSPVNFNDWRAAGERFESMATYRYENLILTGSEEPRRVVGVGVTADFLKVVGVAPQLGRGFREEDDVPGAPPVAVVSYRLWEELLGADPDLSGKTITLDQVDHQVVGVMPPDFAFPNQVVRVWRPARFDYSRMGRGVKFLFCIGRLRPGVSLAEAQVEMDAVARRLEEAYPDNNTNVTVALVPMLDEVVGSSRASLTILMVAVALVLLIACANVANLSLSRVAERQREMAIRAALGAGRLRLVRQLLTESLLLSAVGGGLGLLLATWGVDVLLSLGHGLIPRGQEVGLDLTVLGFTAAAAVATGLLFGLAPALHSTRADLQRDLQQGGRSGGPGAGGRRLRAALVVAEVALSLVLLVGGILLLKSFARLQSVEPGFRADHLLTMQVSLPASRYGDAMDQVAFFDAALARIAAIPGVDRVGGAQDLPFSGSRSMESFTVEGRPPLPPGQGLDADYREITPDYLATLGVPLLQGKPITARDRAETAPVLLVNETMARRVWPGESPLGAHVVTGDPPRSLEVIGVVGDMKHFSLAEPSHPEMYRPFAQDPASRLFLAVRTRLDPAALAPSLRAAVAAVDPDLPVYDLRTMEDRVSGSFASERMSSTLLGTFAAVALLLAAVGVYGVISHGVSQRTREIGVRMAVGARRIDVLRLVTGQGLRLTLAGIALGLAGALVLTRSLASLLFGVSTTDPASFLGAAVFLVAAALAACYVPARRAARVEPMAALRHE